MAKRIAMKVSVGDVITYKIHGDSDDLCTVRVTHLAFDEVPGVFDGKRLDNGIDVWGFIDDIVSAAAIRAGGTRPEPMGEWSPCDEDAADAMRAESAERQALLDEQTTATP